MNDTTSVSEPAVSDEPESFRDVSRTGSPVMRVLPWVVAVAALWFILRTTDLEQLRATAANAKWGAFWLSALTIYGVLFLADSFAVFWVYRRFHVPGIRYRDALPARGASYLLSILNYAAGSLAMAFYFKKRFKVGFLEGSASLLLLMLIDLGLVTVAVLLGGALLPAAWTDAVVFQAGDTAVTWNLAIRIFAAAFVAGAIAHLVFWRATWSWGPLERIRENPSFRGFRDARIVDYAALALVRLPVTILYVLMHGLTLLAFHIHVPWERLLVYVPIQMLIAVVPISPSGLGTVNVAQRYLYESYAFDAAGVQLTGAEAMAAIDAYGLALSLAFNLPRIAIGVIALRAAKAAIARAAASDESRT